MQHAELGMEEGERAVHAKRSQLSPAVKDLIAGAGCRLLSRGGHADSVENKSHQQGSTSVRGCSSVAGCSVKQAVISSRC